MKQLIFGLLTIAAVASGQTLEDAEEAFKQSKDLNRPVLMVFSGSDWCAPCIRLDKKILSQDAFLKYANENLITLKLDFPQRKRISKEQTAQNEQLAALYNPGGLFPHILLVRPDRTVIKQVDYRSESPAEFISQIRAYVGR